MTRDLSHAEHFAAECRRAARRLRSQHRAWLASYVGALVRACLRADATYRRRTRRALAVQLTLGGSK